jgi:acetyl-CoA acyltransferase
MAKRNGARRVAIVAGLRTPFVKSGTAYKNLSALELGKLVVAELLQRSGVAPGEVQQVVYGQVVPSLSAPNIAREIVLGTGMPKDIEAYSVSRLCDRYQSTVNVAESISREPSIAAYPAEPTAPRRRGQQEMRTR